MGKRAVDRTKKIESSLQRSVAFCKRRRGLLKKAIEMSRMCETRVFLILVDPAKDKAVQFQSHADFSLSEAYKSVNRIRKAARPGGFENYTNDDYAMLENTDLRTLNKRGRP